MKKTKNADLLKRRINNMKCTIRNKGCVGYGGNGQCISIENCKYQDRFSKSSNKKCSNEKEDK